MEYYKKTFQVKIFLRNYGVFHDTLDISSRRQYYGRRPLYYLI